MKRDREVIRQILIEVEACPQPSGLEIPSRFSLYADDFIISLNGTEAHPELRSRDYNLILMQRAGLIDFVDKQTGDDFYGGRVRLTPAGHDAAEALSDDRLWERLKHASPGEAYALLKDVASRSAVDVLSRLMGWG